MNSETHAVKLSAREFMYLKNTNFLPEELARIIDASEKGGEGCVVHVTRESAEKLRASLTERLATVSFDQDYKPTAEGEILEDLIDVFYLT